ncbi:MAG: iron-siderophore ABC transporter substrate-binding protein [Cyanobacteria bacterium P01_H01_bin.21]
MAAPFSEECKTVDHAMGTVCIPANPERIVALDPRYLGDPLLSLGVQPVAIAVYQDQGQEGLAGLTPEATEPLKDIGNAQNPSLEKIVEIDPDLILALDFAHEAIYDQLSAIAPTVLLEYDLETFEKYPSFKENLRRIAQLLGKETEADTVLSQYQTRIDQLREQLDRKPEDIEVTVLLHYGGMFGIPHPEHTSHEIFSDIGITDNINTARTDAISLEALDQYDADILFIMDYDRKEISFFLENPIIASLDAVKNNRVYFINADTWSANGPLGVNRMLDDLFQYLPAQS